MHKLIPVAAAALLLSACQLPPQTGTDNPYFSVPPGSTLTLNQPLVIPAGKAAAYIQDGKTVSPYFHIDKYRPSCKFEMRTITDSARTISPDTFTIYRVVRNEESVKREAAPQQVASRGKMAITDNDGGPFVSIKSTVMYLKSARQPDVLRMSCSHWADYVEGQHLSIDEMRKGMGKMFTLKLAK